jgi:hypothetical protein
VGVLVIEPLALGAVGHGDVEPQGGAVGVEPELEAVVRVVQLFDEQVPEPGPIEVELGEVLHELLDHPLAHELLE